ncbi:MAG: leucine-rich repeat protein [Clostridia bacterium]|nr:leucine-rich repeat protein [Clostridia bacterium]
MQKKGFIAVLSAIVLMIVASVSLVLAVGHNASADSEPVLIPVEYLNIHDGVLGDNPFWDGTDAFTVEGLDYIYELSSAYRVVIPDSVTSIDNGAFYNCTNLTSVTIPDSVTSIGDGAFYGCTSLTSITIPDSVTEIENFIFRGCTSLTSVTISDSVTSIGDCMFEGCTSLTSITLSDNIESIGEEAFENCTNLTRVTLGNGVKTIGSYAFHNCESLTSIIIPASVERVEGAVFSGCKELYTVYCECPQAYAEENWSEYWGHWDEEDDGDWRDFRNLCEWNYVIPEYTVTFNTDGGNNIAEQIIRVDNLVTKPTNPTKDGYTFKGWFIGDDEYDFATPVTADMTLTAQWEAIPEPVTPEPEPEQPTTPENPEQPTTPDTDTETVTAGSKNGFNIGAAIGGGLVAGLGSISAIAATVIVRRRHK